MGRQMESVSQKHLETLKPTGPALGFVALAGLFDRSAKLPSSSVELGMDLALFGYAARLEAGEKWAHTLTYRAVA